MANSRAVIVLLALGTAAPASADELKLLAIGAASPVMQRLIPEFERTTGHRVIPFFGPSPIIQEKLRKGEAVDVLIASNAVWGDLEKEKLVQGESHQIARTGVGVGIRKGAPKPDLTTPDALKKALLNAKSVGGAVLKPGTIGAQTLYGFEKLGIVDQVVPKYHPYANGTEIVKAIVQGEIELGMDVIPVMAGTASIDFAGSFPPSIQDYIIMIAGVATSSGHAATAREFIEFVRKPENVAVFKEKFLEPLP